VCEGAAGVEVDDGEVAGGAELLGCDGAAADGLDDEGEGLAGVLGGERAAERCNAAAELGGFPAAVELGEEATDRALGLARDEAVVARCDLLVLVGGRVSEGMARERAAAKSASRAVLDLTSLGEEPPSCAECTSWLTALPSDQIATEARRRGYHVS
jgi:hypothetical protein